MCTKQVMQQSECDPTLPPAVKRNKNTVLRFTYVLGYVEETAPDHRVAWSRVVFISASCEGYSIRTGSGESPVLQTERQRRQCSAVLASERSIYTYLQSATRYTSGFELWEIQEFEDNISFFFRNLVCM